MAISFRLLLLLALVLAPTRGWTADEPQDSRETVTFFESGTIPELKLVIDGEGQQKLRDAPRDYTRCTLTENGTTTLKSIGVKLKGAAGSYRDFDDRPGLTLNIDKFR